MGRPRSAFHLYLLLLCLWLGTLLGLMVSTAYADPMPEQPDETVAIDKVQSKPAAIVRELTEERTAESQVFELADGSRLLRLFDAPVFFQDEKGVWAEIDTRLQADAVAQLSPWATPFDLVLRSATHDRLPVLLGYQGYVVGVEFLDGSQGDPVVSGNKAIYEAVARDTRLSYEATASGFKETLELGSAKAPDEFHFYVYHEGLALRQDETGQWGFYAPGAKEPVFLMADLEVYDSTAEGAVYCSGAQLKVTPSDGGSLVTYTVPEKWLSDPSRTWPVLVDPSVTIKGTSNTWDTFLNYSAPTTSYGSSQEIKVGYIPNEGDHLGLIRFDLDDLTADNRYVTSATLNMRCFDIPSVARHFLFFSAKHSWGESSTWNSYVGTYGEDDIAGYEVGSENASASSWMQLSCRGMAQAWISGNEAAHGFLIDDSSETHSQYFSGRFRSSEYTNATYVPYLDVSYASNPVSSTVTCDQQSYRLGDTVTVNVALTGSEIADVREVRLGINRVSADETRRRGVMCWYHKSPPDESWISRPYEVRNGGTEGEGGYFAYFRGADDGNGSRYMTPLLGDCTLSADHSELTFRFRVGDNWGDVQDNDLDLDVILSPDPDSVYWDENEPRWQTGWTTRASAAFDVVPRLLEAPAALVTSPHPDDNSDWLVETDTNGDGVEENTLSNDNTHARGSVTLSWPEVTCADGYRIYLWDGHGYEPVGATLGSQATTWTSAGSAFYPTDTEIASPTWPGGATGNPFFRAASPGDTSRTTLLQPAGYSGSAGLLAGDGTYLYARARSGRSGSAYWQRIDPQTQAVTQFGPSLTAKPAFSAFYYGGRVYSGYVTKSGSSSSVTGVQTSSPYGDGGAISFSSLPLERDTGASITASTGDVLFATDGTYIYNVAYTRAVNGDGSPAFDGFRIRRYTMAGVASGATTEIAMTSFALSHVLADDDYLYLCEWTGAAGARVLKVAKSDRTTIVNQWSEDQATTGACAGFYDAAHDQFWLGHITNNCFWRYAGVRGGLELRDNPNALYQETDSGTDDYASSTWTHYSFRVVPYNAVTGQAAITASVGVAVTLDNRTMHAYQAPVRTSYAINELPDHTLEAVLDVNGFSDPADDASHLGITVTDLALASWGPPAVLDRTYLSSESDAGYFAPGWRFGFERSLDLSERGAGFISYRDSYGLASTFRGSDTAWTAPDGLHARLVRSDSQYILTFKDRSYLRFGATSGTLVAAGDPAGNETSYAITSGAVTITAANGRSIVATIEDDKITSAHTETQSAAAEQSVAYVCGASASSVTWPLVKDGEGAVTCQRKVTYTAISAQDPHLHRIDVAAVDGDGDAIAGEPTRREEFSYAETGDRRLVRVDLPDYFASPSVAGAQVYFSYAGDISELCVARTAECEGSSQTVYDYLRYNPTGTLRAKSTGWTADQTPQAAFTSYTYAPDNELAATCSPTGVSALSVIDARGNTIASAGTRGGGEVSALSYDEAPDGLDDVATTTYGALGAVTHITYASVSARLVGEVQTEGQGYEPHVPDPALPTAIHYALDEDPAAGANLAQTAYSYEDTELEGADDNEKTYYGRLSSEAVAVAGSPDEPVWSVTDYNSPDLSGAPGETVVSDVGYAPPEDPTMTQPANGDESYAYKLDLTTQATYDGFGRLLTSSEMGPNSDYESPALVETENNTYDLAGRLIATLGPAADGVGRIGRVIAYDVLDREKESYTWNDLARDEGENLIAADWRKTYYETTSAGARLRVAALNGDPALGTVGDTLTETVTDYDPTGQLVSSADSSVGGLPAGERHDLAGNVSESWPEDCQEEDGDNLASHTHGDGYSTESSYDIDNRLLTTHDPSTDPANITECSYGRDGALATQTNPDGSFVRLTYDLAGNLTAETGPDDDYNASTAPYETATTQHFYDAQGQLTEEIDPGMGETLYSYDCAGRLVCEERPSSEPRTVSWAQDTYTYTTSNAVGWKMREHSGDADQNGNPDDVDSEWTYLPDGSVAEEYVGRFDSESYMRTTYAYDDAGRMTAKTVDRGNGESARTLYAYDYFGRLATETRQRIVSETATTQRETTYTYDTLGRELTRTVAVRPGGGGDLETQISDELTYETDDEALGNASVTETTSYAVAALTVSPYTQPDAIVETTKVDGRGRAVSYAVSVPNVGATPTYGLERTVTARDEADRILTLSVGHTQGEAEHPASSTNATWSYNASGQLSAQGGLGFETAGATYTYNAATAERKLATADLKLGADIDERDLYYPEGRVQKGGERTDDEDGTYTYNRHGDIETATAMGTTRTFHYGPQHRLLWQQPGTGDRIYMRWDEANDRRTGEGVGTLADDEWSAPTSYPVSYAYDKAGALTSWTDDTVASAKNKAEYVYDSEGQRIRSVLTEDYADATLANRTVTTTDYLYDDLKLVSATITKEDGNGAPLGAWQIFWFSDASGTPYAGIDRKLSAANGSTHSFYLVTNDHGDVLELLEADHIAFGSYRYDVYGRPIETTWRTTDTYAMTTGWMEPITSDRNIIRYAGYAYDTYSQLYYLQRRYYDAVLRQFLSRDPLKSDGVESPYQYCGGNPVASADPEGLYVTASGNRDDRRIYVPQSGLITTDPTGTRYAPQPVVPASGHHSGRNVGTAELARWRGSVAGSLDQPKSVGRYRYSPTTKDNNKYVTVGICGAWAAWPLYFAAAPGGLFTAAAVGGETAAVAEVGSEKVTAAGEGAAGRAARISDSIGNASSYIDKTALKSRFCNRFTNVTHSEFEENLAARGWDSRPAPSNLGVTLFEKAGARYALRSMSDSYEGWTADFYPSESRKLLEIRLGWMDGR
jgi:RHS repeat-associated protein